MLALDAPATAQAPTLEYRVGVLEQQVRELDERVAFLEQCLLSQGALPVDVRSTKRPYIVVGVVDPRYRAVLIFAVGTGLRPEEWIALERRDVDQRRAWFTFAGGSRRAS